jgi:hypothetical protein
VTCPYSERFVQQAFTETGDGNGLSNDREHGRWSAVKAVANAI